jgi:hypothetical protein
MKHVFIIHSNITYLSALGVIMKEKINLDDVVILSWNNFQREEPVKVHRVKQYDAVRNIFRHPIDYIFKVRYLDRTIAKLVDYEPYIAYTEALYFFHDVVVTHPLCQKFNFIEEGLVVYAKEINWQQQTANYSQQPCYRYCGWSGFLQKLRDIKMIVQGYKLEMLGLPAFYNAFFCTRDIKFYGFCEQSFYGVEHREVMDIKAIGKHYKWSLYYRQLKDVDIWLGQNNPQGGNALIDTYVKAIEIGCAQRLLSQGKKKVMVKFHPFEEQYAKEQTIAMFNRHGIAVEIIPDEVILELELMNSENVRLYSVCSSLLVYAALMGVECNSIICHMPEESMVDAPIIFEKCNMV